MPNELPPVQHDPQDQRFYIPLEGRKDAQLDYERKNHGAHQLLDFKATFVPPKDRKQGLASEIVEQAFRYAEEKGYKIMPTCPFVDALLKQKPAFEHLRAE